MRSTFPFLNPKLTSVLSFGTNLIASEGASWRRQRRIIAPTFSERNNHLVWKESITQAQAMLQTWLGDQRNGKQTLDTLQEDLKRLPFHVINTAGFGVQLAWPTSKVDKDKEGCKAADRTIFTDRTASDEVMPGHSMSYKDALLTTTANLRALFILPKWFLSTNYTSRYLRSILTVFRDRTVSVHQKIMAVVCPLAVKEKTLSICQALFLLPILLDIFRLGTLRVAHISRNY